MTIVKYRNDVEEFPANLPFGSPHVIENIDDVIQGSGIHMADLVATVLYNVDPTTKKAVKAFLNLGKDFSFYRKELAGGLFNLVIKRKAKVVKIGFIDDGKTYWDRVFEYHMWESPTYPWITVLYRFLPLGRTESRPECINQIACGIIHGALMRKVWKESSDAKVKYNNKSLWNGFDDVIVGSPTTDQILDRNLPSKKDQGDMEAKVNLS